MLLLMLTSTSGSAEPPYLFSTQKPGQAVTPELIIALPKINPNKFDLVEDEGKTVLQVSSSVSAATIALALTSPAGANAHLEWRWRVSNVLNAADMDRKSGDDFAARIYVFFDAPLSSMPFVQRTKIRLARLIWGERVPTAALCYVWDNKHPMGYSRVSPYTDRVRVIVLQTGAANAGKWMNESRDVVADFKSAFAVDAPAITGVAVGSDTDQTGESVRTWFGDVVLKR